VIHVMNTKLKLMTATAGTGALLAMGGVAMATSAAEPSEPAPPGPVTSTPATTAETTTLTTAPPAPTSPSATPEIEGPAPLPPELEGVPG
jgi:hypothetical protein